MITHLRQVMRVSFLLRIFIGTLWFRLATTIATNASLDPFRPHFLEQCSPRKSFHVNINEDDISRSMRRKMGGMLCIGTISMILTAISVLPEE